MLPRPSAAAQGRLLLRALVDQIGEGGIRRPAFVPFDADHQVLTDHLDDLGETVMGE